jgi:hypothetical protein
MSRERVESIRDFLDRFDRAGEHFRESRRQGLLGLREAVIVLEDLAATYGEEVPVLRTLATGLLLGRGALDMLVGRMPPLEDAERVTEIRIEAMGILRDLLTAELMRSETGEGDAQRRDGLMTVIGVIDQEIERLAAEMARTGSTKVDAKTEPRAPSVDWIEVES